MTDISNLEFSSILKEPSLQESFIIADYSEYSGESIDSIISNINKHKNATAEEFNNILSKNNNKFETQVEFYKTSNSYIYDLLTVNGTHEGVSNKLNGFIINLMENMKAHHSQTFAEFGGGIGILCEIMHVWGKKTVTYIDIESSITDFARWRFKKYNLDIEMIIIPQDDFNIDRKFGMVFTDAVWEHLTPTQQLNYANKLAQMIEPDGGLIFIVDVEGETENMPMHYNVDLQSIFDIFVSNKMGMLEIPRLAHITDTLAKFFASAWVKMGPQINKHYQIGNF